MSGRILAYLERHLAAGACRIGQILITGSHVLTHVDDASRAGLAVFTDGHDALEIARLDDEGKFRALKSAPNLRHGWRLELRTPEEVRMALDFFYPAALAIAMLQEESALVITALEETLRRQTGMYAVVKKITPEQAETVCTKTCDAGCLRQILWRGHGGKLRGVVTKLMGPEIPLHCPEACNLWVANGRKVVKGGE